MTSRYGIHNCRVQLLKKCGTDLPSLDISGPCSKTHIALISICSSYAVSCVQASRPLHQQTGQTWFPEAGVPLQAYWTSNMILRSSRLIGIALAGDYGDDHLHCIRRGQRDLGTRMRITNDFRRLNCGDFLSYDPEINLGR